MIWAFFGVVAVGLVGVFAALISGRWSPDPMSEPTTSTPDAGLPEEPTASAVDEVRFDTALRGYRMDQVDDVLDTLRDTIADQQATIARLRGLASSELDHAVEANQPVESIESVEPVDAQVAAEQSADSDKPAAQD